MQLTTELLMALFFPFCVILKLLVLRLKLFFLQLGKCNHLSLVAHLVFVLKLFFVCLGKLGPQGLDFDLLDLVLLTVLMILR